MINLTEKIWIDSQIDPDFLDVLKEFTAPLSEDNSRPVSSDKDKSPIFQLAYWCCQAVGADLHQADLITNLWVLFQSAAQLLDTIEDGDERGEPLKKYSLGELVNISTGLIILAELVLSELENETQIEATIAHDLRIHFNRYILRTCGGQHFDLSNRAATLEEGWQIAEAKSGDCVSLVCYAVARLGTDSIDILNTFKQFGHYIGTIIQIKDDISGLWDENLNTSDLAKAKHSLPVLYALEVLPKDRKDIFQMLIENPHLEDSVAQARKIIIESGAVLYLSMEIEKRKLLAKELLSEITCPEDSTVTQQLQRILDHVATLEDTAIIHT